MPEFIVKIDKNPRTGKPGEITVNGLNSQEEANAFVAKMEGVNGALRPVDKIANLDTEQQAEKQSEFDAKSNESNPA